MQQSFYSECFKEGNRTYMNIPFHVWDTFGVKGNIPVKVIIHDMSFECKLIPKGNGNYLIPIKKQFANCLELNKEYAVSLILLEQLTRINHNSLYSKEQPIRRIHHIDFIRQSEAGYCGQACIAMLAGISIDEVINVLHIRKWQASIGKVLEALDYYGITYQKPVYIHNKEIKLPDCCILNTRNDKKSHLMIYFKGFFYDPANEVTMVYPLKDIISFIEIEIS